MKTRKILYFLLLCILLCCLFSSVFALNKFLIRPNDKVCEELTSDNVIEVVGKITVTDGSVDFFVLDPNNKTMFSLDSIVSHDFKFRTDDNGTYTLCFVNLNQTNSVYVELDYNTKSIFSGHAWDINGLITSGFTLGIVVALLVKSHRNKRESINESLSDKNRNLKDSMKKYTMELAFIAILFIAVWLGTRTLLLFIHRYLLEEGYVYTQYEILDLIAYALTINLVFTLLKKIPEEIELKQIVDTAIQSVLIGIIVLLPKYGDAATLSKLGGGVNYAFLIIAIGILLLCLALTSKSLNKNKSRLDSIL